MEPAHQIIEDLKAIVGDAGVVDEPNELKVYESDAFTIARGQPTCVVFPTTTQQVSACVKALNKHDLPIVPRGSGTGLAGNAVVYGQGVLIATTRMARIEKVDLKNRYAIVQAGVRNLALTEAIASTGLRFSPDPSSQRATTIGGNSSTNAGGINTLKHGVTTNHVLGMELVLADGTIVNTRNTGVYDGIGADVPALMCGSEGTFGIVCRLWCRLVPNPKHLRTVYAVFNSVADSCKTVSDVIAAGLVPTSMEMMDGPMISVLEDAFHFGFDTSAGAMLLLEIDGVDQILDEQMEGIAAIARENGATDIQQCADPKRRQQLWAARKQAFGAIGRASPSYCTQDACVPRSRLPEVMKRVGELADEFGLKITNVFHAGDGNIHPIILFDEDDPEQVRTTLRLGEAILSFCVDVGGTITGEHGVGIEKLDLMGKMFNCQTLDTFLNIKKAFDPEQRLNDSKKIPSDRLRIELLKPIAANVPGGAL